MVRSGVCAESEDIIQVLTESMLFDLNSFSADGFPIFGDLDSKEITNVLSETIGIGGQVSFQSAENYIREVRCKMGDESISVMALQCNSTNIPTNDDFKKFVFYLTQNNRVAGVTNFKGNLTAVYLIPLRGSDHSFL